MLVMMARFTLVGGNCADVGRRQLPSRFFEATLIPGAVYNVRGTAAAGEAGLAGNGDCSRHRCECQNRFQWPFHVSSISTMVLDMRYHSRPASRGSSVIVRTLTLMRPTALDAAARE